MKGNIVLLRFPFDDFSATKVRPAVILTEPITTYQQIIAAFVTSKIPRDLLATDVILDPAHPSFHLSGLRIRSALRLHHLATFNEDNILRELGELSAEIWSEIERKLRILFEI